MGIWREWDGAGLAKVLLRLPDMSFRLIMMLRDTALVTGDTVVPLLHLGNCGATNHTRKLMFTVSTFTTHTFTPQTIPPHP